MSGHSKWSTIKRQKGAADIKRGMTFTKIANAITIATKMSGSPDPGANPRLRLALEQARAANMPNTNVQRAIDRGLGKLPGQSLEEVTFEGFGPGKVAFLIEGVIDNKARTLQEIKNLFEKAGGSLAGQGSVLYMFDRVGEIKIRGRGGREDEEMLELIDLGAEDVEEFEEPFDSTQGKTRKYLVYVNGQKLNAMSNKLTQVGFTIESQDLVFKPNTLMEIKDQDMAQKVVEFSQKLEELDGVQKVYANFDIDKDLI